MLFPIVGAILFLTMETIATGTERLFDPEHVAFLFERPTHDIADTSKVMFPNELYVAVFDAGNFSIGIMSGYFFDTEDDWNKKRRNFYVGSGGTGNHLVITGVDTKTCHSKDEQTTLLVNHIMQLRQQNPDFERTRIYVYVEDGSGREPMHFRASATKLKDVRVFLADAIRGDRTNAFRCASDDICTRKYESPFVILYDMLQHAYIHFSSSLFVVPDHSDDDDDDDNNVSTYSVTRVKHKLRQQLDDAQLGTGNELHAVLSLLVSMPESRFLHYKTMIASTRNEYI